MSPPLLFDCDLPHSPSSLDQQPPVVVAPQKRRRPAGASSVPYTQEPQPSSTTTPAAASVIHHNHTKPLRGTSSPVRRLSSSSLTSATTVASSTAGSLTPPPRGDTDQYCNDVVDLEAAPLSVPLLAVSVGGRAAAPAVTAVTTGPPRSRGRARHLLQSLASRQAWKLAFGASGVYACYLAYGHLQEDIYRFEAPFDGSKFQAVWYLQVLECACNVLVGLVGRRLCGGTRPTQAALRGFAQSGTSQVLAKVLTSLSLAAGLSFPVCVLAKSAKIVPVMLGQLIIGGSQYRAFDAVWAGAVVLGTTLLSLGGSKAGTSQPQLSTPAGLAFILLSLVMDGITAGLQKRLKKDTEGRPPTTYDFLLFTNAAMGIVALIVALALGDLRKGSLFLAAHPVVQQMVFLSCLLSALGQSFVFYVVAHFDPMVCATVTTTRKILSVVWSVATKGHSVSSMGGAGLTLAIGGVLLGLVGGEGETKAQVSPPQQPRKPSSHHLPRHRTNVSKHPLQRTKAPRSPEPDVVVVAEVPP